MIYLDNAATSWPKPETVYEAVDRALRDGGNPGRGNHRASLAAAGLIREARMLCAGLFHAERPECICFTSNTTEALNLAIKGMLRPGDHVITSSMEHNSVVRPLKKLESRNITTTKVLTSPETGVDLDALEKAFQANTRLVVCSHIFNVTGTVNPIREIGELCRKHNVPFLLDAAQSAGMKKIDVIENNISLLAFPGHKGLLGPQGTGGLYIRDGLMPEPLMEGGTGTQSERYDQPEQKPERYESGTLNLPGLAGLAAGVKYILNEGLEKIEKKETELTTQLMHELNRIDSVRIYGPEAGKPRGSVVSITLENIGSGEAGLMLDSAFQIAARAGLHCARDAHETLGTINKGGTLRISPNYFNTGQDIEQCIEAIRSISQRI